MSHILVSQQDASVNFVQPASVGFFESRYVRRVPRYFSLYLSSQSGCNQACRMCHLTATKQTKLVDATPQVYYTQAREILHWYQAGLTARTLAPAQQVHYNFMARGEALNNELFLENATDVLLELGQHAVANSLVPRFLISTIMPRSLSGKSLADLFPIIAPEIYYSIYSTREAFRKKWLPNALPFEEALRMLREYQDQKRVILKLHWAFIEGENDDEFSVRSICHHLNESGIQANIAIVRYNSFSAIYGQEPPEAVIDRNVKLMERLLPNSRVKKITRVGLDVKASCGMFVGSNGL